MHYLEIEHQIYTDTHTHTEEQMYVHQYYMLFNCSQWIQECSS